MRAAIGRVRLLGAIMGLAIGVGTASTARAAVDFSLAAKGSPTTTSGTYYIGTTFQLSVDLSLTSMSDVVAGVDYQVQSATPTLIQLSGRDSTGSFFDETNAASFPEPLYPYNGTNLGGNNSNLNTLTGVTSNNVVANLTFTIPQATVPGTYKLSFYFNSSGPPYYTDYQGGSPGYLTTKFDSLGNAYSVTVMAPEPASAFVLALAGLGLLRRRHS